MYFEIEIQTNNEGQESKGIYSYEAKDNAVAVFHQKMASGITAGLAGNLKKVLNMVINEQGGTITREYWEAPEEPTE